MIIFDFKLIERDTDFESIKESIIESHGESFSDTLKLDLETIDENRVAELSIDGAKELHQWLANQMFWEFDYFTDTQKLGPQERKFLEPQQMEVFVKLNKIGFDLQDSIWLEELDENE